MREPFLPSEIKTLLLQILSATEFLHSHWILHRDLKTSNLLMNNRGEIKLADFGMARYYGDPPPKLTQLVVTLWYRSPELLLGSEKYGPEIDVWSIGCIFGELLTNEPLFQGKNEVDQLSKVLHVYICHPNEFSNIFWSYRSSLSLVRQRSKRGHLFAPSPMLDPSAYRLAASPLRSQAHFCCLDRNSPTLLMLALLLCRSS